MKDSFRGQYTLEFKQEAVRLVRGGEGVSSVAKSLGISGQTLHNWTLLRTSPNRGVSDSLVERGSEADRCAGSLAFSTSTSGSSG